MSGPPRGIKPANIFAFNVICKLAGDRPTSLLCRAKLSTASFAFPYPALGKPLQPASSSSISSRRSSPPKIAGRNARFLLQLRQALLDDPFLSLVLALKEDYLAGLDPYASLLPGQLRPASAWSG